jgi:hypothetical protein
MCVDTPFTTERMIMVWMSKNFEWPAIRSAIRRMVENREIKEISRVEKSITYILLAK